MRNVVRYLARLDSQRPVSYLFHKEEQQLVLCHSIAVLTLFARAECLEFFLFWVVRLVRVYWSLLSYNGKDLLGIGS